MATLTKTEMIEKIKEMTVFMIMIRTKNLKKAVALVRRLCFIFVHSEIVGQKRSLRKKLPLNYLKFFSFFLNFQKIRT